MPWHGARTQIFRCGDAGVVGTTPNGDRDQRANVPREAKALAAALRAAELPEVLVRVQSGKVWIGEVPLESVAALGKALAKLRF